MLDAIEAVHGFERRPDCVVVTGDLVQFGNTEEYERFRQIMSALEMPYFVIPGNHDDARRLRAALPPQTYGAAGGTPLRYAVDDFAVRIIGLDVTMPRPWPGAGIDEASLAWLDRTLATAPEHPAILLVHQPPFRTGLPYLDLLGFRGARRLRALVERHPQLGRVICGHIHCVRSSVWGHALALSGPSTAPQLVPRVSTRGAVLERERAGFVLHELTDTGGFTTTVYRRETGGSYAPTSDLQLLPTSPAAPPHVFLSS